MSDSPSVSVVMSVHNGETYLRPAIESILQQTFSDFEFIIVDDGSTDSSAAILKEFSAVDVRIRLLARQNEGLTKALNHGLRQSRGEFIARFDADDISLPERFARQVDALCSDKSLVLLGSEVELISKDGLRLGIRGHAQDHEEIRHRLLWGNGGALTHPAVMIRKSALETICGYDERFTVAQDLDLFLRLSEIGRVSNLPDVLLLWRRHDCSINNTRYDLWMTMKRLAMENTIKRIGPAEFAKHFFYAPETVSCVRDPVNLGKLAEAGRRYLTAARFYMRAIGMAGRRRTAVKRLLSLALRTLWIKVGPYLQG
jgi:glycosyltransferase involved in cell wall biosynthesis